MKTIITTLLLIVLILLIAIKGEAQTSDPTPPHSILRGKVLLQGAYRVETGKMTTDLAELMPLCAREVFNQTTTKYVYRGNDCITREDILYYKLTDWMLIELRNIIYPSQYFTKAIVVNENGQWLSPQDFTPDIKFNIPFGNYHCILIHKTHISVMSSNPVRMFGEYDEYDFTTGLNKYYGNDAKNIGDIYCMYAGEFAGNYSCPNSTAGNNIIDLDEWCEWTNNIHIKNKSYITTDANMDAYVTTVDFDYYIWPNFKKYSRVPYNH